MEKKDISVEIVEALINEHSVYYFFEEKMRSENYYIRIIEFDNRLLISVINSLTQEEWSGMCDEMHEARIEIETVVGACHIDKETFNKALNDLLCKMEDNDILSIGIRSQLLEVDRKVIERRYSA